MPKKLTQVGETSIKVVFVSPFYTVVEATTSVSKGANGGTRVVFTEGISRRSWRDRISHQRGIDIATGRAQKAMNAKLSGKHIWERIQKATDLLSNG